MYFAQGHYRKPIEFSPDALEQARRAVDRIRELVRRLDNEDASGPPEAGAAAERFFDALADDFNTPAALAVLFEWVSDANRRLDAGERVGVGALRDMLHAVGFENLLDEPAEQADADALRLLDEREAARAERDFATADARRDQLLARGWVVRDTPDGPQLVRSE